MPGQIHTKFYFNQKVSQFNKIVDISNAIFITDENVYSSHNKLFAKRKAIVIPAGEQFKTQATVDSIVQQLISLNADRTTMLIGIGGGVITDITGYVASVFMRGICFGFVPSTLLAMVDASIGGKNGIDVGLYKNLVGTINQPQFIVYDYNLLNTLPQQHWQNGFAEIIKHACIKNATMFKQLQNTNIEFYKKNVKALAALVEQNALLKLRIVKKDITEKGDRKLLNFGHTLGHAIENKYRLYHGEAVAIGMMFACKLSQQILHFKDAETVGALLQQYHLPVSLSYNTQEVFEILQMDKKRVQKAMNFILLEKTGKGKIMAIPLQDIKKML